jgi:predicted O-methyltransferase YrrM
LSQNDVHPRDGTEDRWSAALEVLEAHRPARAASGDATLSADSCAAAVALVQRFQLRNVIELGGGASTLALGAALPEGGRMLSLDHSPHYLSLTREAVREKGLDDRVTTALAPIRIRRAGAYFAASYDLRVPEGAGPFDFALIDGPPSLEVGRFLTLPMLWPHLSVGALVLADDTNRIDLEGVWLREWEELYRGRMRMQTDPLYTKGATLIMKLSDGPPTLRPALAARYAARSARRMARRLVWGT